MELVKGNYKIIVDEKYIIFTGRASYGSVLHKIPINEVKATFGMSLEELLMLNDYDFNKIVGDKIYDEFETHEIESRIDNYKIEIFPKEEKVKITDVTTLKSVELSFDELARMVSDEDLKFAMKMAYGERRLYYIMTYLALSVKEIMKKKIENKE